MEVENKGGREMASITAGRVVTAGVKSTGLKRLLEWAGIAAGIVLIAFGIGSIAMSVDGRSTVRDSLKLEQIVGTPDMTPSAIAAEAKDAGLPASTPMPKADIAGKAITTGGLARDFAQYMRIHTLESTGGLTYAQMGRFATADGKPAGTNDAAKAVKDSQGQPVANGARNIWVTETALTTALNTSYMAEQLSLFGLVVGIALLLSGIGFVILALAALRPKPAAAA
jgi:hypothetical protein